MSNRLSRMGRMFRLNRGFTLAELLVGLITSSLFLVSTSSIVIGIITQDRRENAKIDTQSELQLAMDYIRRDLQQAVYVYSGQQMQDILLTPGHINTSDTPVFAFWKVGAADECEASTSPACTSDPLNQNIGNLALSGHKFELVAYYWQSNVGDTTWPDGQFGPGRVTRLVLGPFDDSGAQRADYRAPEPPNYLDWPYSGAYGLLPPLNGALSPRQVLTAYVDSDEATPAPTAVACPAGYDPSPNVTGSPSAANAYYAFYACVSNQGVPQDVTVFLRGNAIARADGLANASDAAFYPTLQTTVFARTFFD